MSEAPWSVLVLAAEAARGLDLQLEADAAARARIAAAYGLEALERFDARVRLDPWLDGLRLRADWRARAVYACGLTLEPFPAELQGHVDLRLLPEGSPHAPEAAEVDGLGDPEAEDPPELYAGDRVDVGDLLAQHLSVELDPFPRKPGAEFAPPPEPAEPSPFAALAALKPKP